eukprot:38760-Chlamydomonas_euryale.AAC.1
MQCMPAMQITIEVEPPEDESDVRASPQKAASTSARSAGPSAAAPRARKFAVQIKEAAVVDVRMVRPSVGCPVHAAPGAGRAPVGIRHAH